jgi:hypothetical protein
VFCDAPRDFAFTHDDEICPELRQIRNLVVGVRARNYLELRVYSACMLDEMSGFERVRYGADEPPGASEVCRLKQSRLGGMAKDDLNAPPAQLLNDFTTFLDDKEGLPSASMVFVTKLPTGRNR